MTKTKPKLSKWQKDLKIIQRAMTAAVAGIKDHNIPKFGAHLSRSSGKDAAICLIAHRLVNKWYIPSRSHQQTLVKECFDKWVAHEEKISQLDFEKPQSRVVYDWENDAFKVRYENTYFESNHFKAIDLMRSWLKPVSHKLKMWDSGDNWEYMDIEFTPGETFYTSKGLTSVKQKLMSSDWTVTDDLINWSLNAIRFHKSLREVALARLQPIMVDELWNTRVFRAFLGGHIDCETMFVLCVRKYLLKVVNGARGATAPKSNEVVRFINIEPLLNMIYQRGVGLIIRSALKDHASNDLEIGQHEHRAFICTMLYTSADLRNASDSNIYVAARALISAACPVLWTCIDRSRSATTLLKYPDGHLEEHVNTKLSSMGNGFTFEVMTLLLLAQARVFDASARVYGDDVLIRNDGPHGLNAYIMFKDLITTTGWEINVDKTFHDSDFYESCGGFYHKDLGNLVSYDFGPILTTVDLIVTINKLTSIISWCDDNNLSHPLINTLEDLRSSLWAVTSAVSRGPRRLKGVTPLNKARKWDLSEDDTTVNADYVEVDNYLAAHKRCSVARSNFKKHIPLAHWAKANGYITRLPKAVIKVHRYKAKLASASPLDVQCVFTKASYFYSNRVSKDEVRGKGHWSTITCFVFDDGYILPIAHLRNTRILHFRANCVGPKPRCYHTVLADRLESEASARYISAWHFGWYPGM